MSEDKINILHIDTEKTWRGGEAQAFSLCKGLASGEFRPLILAQPDSPLSGRMKEQGLDILEMNMKGEFDLASAYRISRIIRKRNIRLIHTHDAHAHTLAWIATVRRPDVPVIVSRRVDFSVGGNFISSRKYHSPRVHYIAISRGVRDILMSGGVPKDRIDIVFSGIHHDKFSGDHNGDGFRKDIGVNPDEILIGNIGALTDHKGHKYLIDAAPKVIEKIPDVRFIIVGKGELRNFLEKRIRDNGLQNRVILTGYRDDIGDCLKALDLFALSSHLEGLCTSILDAMLMKVPVVATRTGGVPDAVIHKETGLLAEPKNPGALADAIIKLLENEQWREEFTEAAYRRVMQYFTVEKMVEGTKAVYRKILRNGRSS